jgi:hypothetical protein
MFSGKLRKGERHGDERNRIWGRKLNARQYGNGWQIEIRSLAGEQMQTMTFRELSDAIDEAKKIVDALDFKLRHYRKLKSVGAGQNTRRGR